MKIYQCDLCGTHLGVANASCAVSHKGMELGTFSNNLRIISWKSIPIQEAQIECAYDLCDDCAKAIHRKLMHIANNYSWRNKENKREWN